MKSTDDLTNREWEVLHLLALGLSNKEIARQLVISISTIEKHLWHIYRKLNASNRVEVCNWYRETSHSAKT